MRYFFNSIKYILTLVLDKILVFLLNFEKGITKFKKYLKKYLKKLGEIDIQNIHPMTITTPLDTKTGRPWCTEIIIKVNPNYYRTFLFDRTQKLLQEMIYTELAIYIHVEIKIIRINNETITRHRNIAHKTNLRKNDNLDLFFDSTLEKLTEALEYYFDDGDNETSITITIVIRNFI